MKIIGCKILTGWKIFRVWTRAILGKLSLTPPSNSQRVWKLPKVSKFLENFLLWKYPAWAARLCQETFYEYTSPLFLQNTQKITVAWKFFKTVLIRCLMKPTIIAWIFSALIRATLKKPFLPCRKPSNIVCPVLASRLEEKWLNFAGQMVSRA